jgi:RND family efflux transporter MFP subunit
MTDSVKKLGPPLLILGGGAALFLLLLWTRKEPARKERSYVGPLVEAVALPARTVLVVVGGQGTVQPGAQVDLVPQVGGTVVWKSPDLETGGFFSDGQALLRIDAEEYRLQVVQARAGLAQTRFQFEVATQEAEVTGEEWERFRGEGAATPTSGSTPLSMQEAQVRAARAEFEAAAAHLAVAEIRHRRTELFAPFSGRVQASLVDLRQFVTQGRSVARLYSTETAEVVVPLPDDDLFWLRGSSGKNFKSARAIVTGRSAGVSHAWEGRVVRTGAELDPRSRMAQVIVSVKDPYADPAVPLVAGMFVDVAIDGLEVEGVRLVPRQAVRGGNSLWVVGQDSILKVRSMEVLRFRKDDAIARVDLAQGERVVMSFLSEVNDGMRVRVRAAAPVPTGADSP